MPRAKARGSSNAGRKSGKEDKEKDDGKMIANPVGQRETSGRDRDIGTRFV